MTTNPPSAASPSRPARAPLARGAIRALPALAALAAALTLAACGGGGGGGGSDTDSRLRDVAPTFSSQPVTSVVVGSPYAYRASVTARPTAILAAIVKPAWLTFDPATGLLAGTPQTADAGDHPVELRAANGVQPDATQAFTVTVRLAPTITSTAPVDARVGVAYQYVVATTGNPAPTLTATGAGGGPLPGWLTFAAATRTLSGTAAASDVGLHDVVITAANGVAPNAVQTFTIDVSAAPAFTSTPITVGLEAAVYTYTATSSGVPQPTLSAPTLPAWLAFDPATGVLTGTPGLAFVGANPVVLAAANGTLPDAQQSFVIQVAAGTAPTITSAAVTDALAGSAYQYDVVVANANPPAVLAAASAGGGALPAWLAFDPATGRLSGTPLAADAGAYDIVVTASNQVAPDAVQAFTIGVRLAPSFTSAPPTAATQGAALTYQLTADGFPAPTFTVTGLPAWLGFNGTDTLGGTPSGLDLGLSPTITVTAANGTSPSATQTFQIDVAPAAALPLAGAPVAEAFAASLPAGWSASGVWQFGLPTAGPPAPFRGEAAGTVLGGKYPPNARAILQSPVLDLAGIAGPRLRFFHFFRTEGGRDGGNLKISSDGGRTFQVLAASAIITPGGAYNGNVAAFSPAEPGWSGAIPGADWRQVDVDLDLALGAAPRNAVVVRWDFASDGVLEDFGWYVDAVEVGDLADFPGLAPAITSVPTGIAAVGFQFRYVARATGSPTPTLTATGGGGGALPAWLRFDAATGVLDGVPVGGDVGVHQVEIKATNGVGQPVVQAFAIDVQAPVPPTFVSAPLTTATAGQPFTDQIAAAGIPAPQIAVTGLPAWLVFDGTDTLSGTPSALDAGTSGVIVITAQNGALPNATQSYSIDVAPAAGLPLAVLGALVEGFAAPPAGWSLSGDWETGLPTVGPPAAFRGACAATKVGANYTDGVRSILQTPVLDLTGVAAPALRFHHFYDTNSTSDGANLKLSIDGGQTFFVVPGQALRAPSLDYDGTILATSGHALSGQPGWSNRIATGDWSFVDVDLDAVLGALPRDEVVIRFDFASNATANDVGWYVDEVMIGDPATFPAPAIVSAPPRAASVGSPYSYTVVATGAAPLTLTATGAGGAALPAWLAFDPATRVLSGNPSAAFAGDHDIEVRAANGVPPDALQAFRIQVAQSVEVVRYNFDQPAVQTKQAAAVAANVTAGNFDAQSGASFLATGGVGGTVAMTAANWASAGSGNFFQLTITPAPGFQVSLTGLAFSDQRSGTGPTTWQAFRVSAGGAATALAGGAGSTHTAIGTGLNTLAISGADQGPFAGPVSIRLVGAGATNATGTWRVDNVVLTGIVTSIQQSAPAITSTPPAAATVGAPLTYAIAATGNPAPTLAVAGLPSWLAFDAATGVVSGTPTVFDLGLAGPISVTATNGVQPDALQVFFVDVPAPGAAIALLGSTLNEDFEAGLPAGWSMSGDWEIGTPAPTSGTGTAFVPGPLEGDLAATRLAAPYSASSVSRLQTPVLDFTGVANPALHFRHFFLTENNFDGGHLKISADAGRTFALVPASSFSAATRPYNGTGSAGTANVSMRGAPIWTTNPITAYEKVEVDLGLLLGTKRDEVVIRFDFTSDSSVQRNAGWYVDAVRLGDASTFFGLKPGIASTPPTTANQTVPYSYVVAVTGDPAPAVTATGPGGAPLPGWLALTPATRTLSGTPQAADVGQRFAIVVTADNGTPPAATQSFTIDVFGPPAAPQITSAAPTAAQSGVAFLHQPVATASPPATWSLVGAPGWLAIDPQTGELSGTPSGLDVGTAAFTLRAANGVGSPADQAVSLDVAPAAAISLATVALGEPFSNALPPGWDADGDWEFGTPPARSGTGTTLTAGPFDGALAATKLAANYSISSISRLQTPVLDMTAVALPELHFRHFFNMETSDDGANLKLSTDGGRTFALIPASAFVPPSAPYNGTSSNVNANLPLRGAPIFTNTIPTGDWEAVVIDLDAALGAAPRGQVVIRWDFGSDPSVVRPGWFIDDVLCGDPATFQLPARITSTTPPAVAQQDLVYRYVLTAAGLPDPVLSATQLPTWLTFHPSGLLSGTPGAGDLGSHNVTLEADNGVGAPAVLAFTVTVSAAGGAPILVESFGAALPAGWTATGDWEFGVPINVGPPAPFAAECAATIIDGLYNNSGAASALTTPTIDLSGRTGVLLRFQHYYDINGNFDGANLKLSTDGGATFDVIPDTAFAPPTVYDGVIGGGHPLDTEPGFFDIVPGNDWALVEVDLDAAIGAGARDQVRIRWDFGATTVVNEPGWYVDEVVIADAASFPPVPPSITSAPATAVSARGFYRYDITTSGSPLPVVAVTLAGGGALPGFLAFDPATQVLTGAPAATDVGVYDLVVTATNGTATTPATQTFTLTVTPFVALAGTPIFELFSAGAPAGWQLGGDWEAGPAVVLPANVAALNGNLIGTRLAGNYTTDLRSRLDTPVLDFTGVVDATLRFDHTFDTAATTDGGNLKLSTDGGATFAVIPGSALRSGAYNQAAIATGTGQELAGQPGYVNGPPATANGWQEVDVDLEALLSGLPRDRVVLRWDFDSNSATDDDGWFVDNVRIGDPALFPPVPPDIASTAVVDAREGLVYTYAVRANGTAPFTFAAITKPAWLALDPSGLLFGTPGAGDVGPHTVTIEVANATPPADTQTFTVTVLAAGQTPVLAEAFGVGVPAQWTATGDWQVGLPAQTGGFGPAQPFDGELAATILAGSYTRNTRSRLTSPVLDLTGVANPTLRFVHYFDMFNDDDGGNVKISTDGGATFAVLPASDFTQGAYTGVIDTTVAGQDLQNEDGFVFGPTGFVTVEADLAPTLNAAAARNQVVIRFDFDSDDNTNLDDGWYVDNVMIGDPVTFAGFPTKAPQLTSAPPLDVSVGSLYRYAPTASAIPPALLTVESQGGGPLPAFLSFDRASGVLEGTPGLADLGSHPLVVRAENGAGAPAVQSFTLQVLQIVPLLNAPIAEDFPGATALPSGWRAIGDWDVGAPTVLPTGVAAALNGNCAATRVAGQYTNDARSQLDTPTLDFTGVVQATLRFDHTFDMNGTIDAGNLKISTDSGASFSVIPATAFRRGVYNSTAIGTSAGQAMAGEPGYVNGPPTTANGWETVEVDLDAVLGAGPRSRVVVRWDFDANTGTTLDEGWYVDNIRIGDPSQFAPVSPDIVTTPATDAREGLVYSYAVAANGTAPFTFSGTLPAWLTLDPSGLLFGTPAAADVGPHSVTVVVSNGGALDGTQTFTVTVSPAGVAPVMAEGFGGATAPAGWTAGGDWQFGLPVQTGGFGPAQPFDGPLVATILAGSYTQNTRSVLETPTVDLTGIQAPTLSFVHFFDMFGTEDGGNLKFSTDGGATFAVVPDAAFLQNGHNGTLTVAASQDLGGQRGWVNGSTNFVTVNVDLDAVLGAGPRNQVRFRFDFDSNDNASLDDGWYVDNVLLGDPLTFQGFPLSPPVFTSAPRLGVSAGAEYRYTASAAGTPAPIFSASLAGGAPLPAWLRFDRAQRALVGTPGIADLGDYDIVVTATNGVAPDATQAFRLTVFPVLAVATTPLAESFSGAGLPPAWSVVQGEWEVGDPGPAAGLSANFPGRLNGHSVGTNIDGLYTINLHSTLDSPVLDLTGVVTPRLRFDHWFDMEGSFDGGNLKLSTDAGRTFAVIPATAFVTGPYTGTLSATANGQDLRGEPAYVNSPAPDAWSRVEVDLDLALGAAPRTRVMLRWDFDSDASVADEGWYVDNVRVGDPTQFPPVPPDFTSQPVTRADEGVLYEYAPSVTGDAPITFVGRLAGGGALPAFLAVDPATGLVAGTPSPADLAGSPFQVELVASNGGLPDAVQAFALTVRPRADLLANPIVDDFGGGVPAGFTATGDWEVGVPANGGPPAPFDGACIGTNVDGQYANARRSILETPVMDLVGVADATLDFVHYYDTATGADGGNLKLSTDGGKTFALIAASRILPPATPYTGNMTTAQTFDPSAPGWFDQIPGNDWQRVRVDLDAALGAAPRDQVVIRWDFGTSTATQDFGWYLDAIRIGDVQDFPEVAPAIVSTPVTQANVGAAYAYQIVATGTPPPALTAGITRQPSWLSFNPATGVLSGTPQAGDFGDHPVTITATSGATTPATQTFTVVVFTPPSAPTITSTAPTQAAAGRPYLYTVTVDGSPPPTLTLASGAPSWLSVDSTAREVFGTPSILDLGANTLSLVATNASGTDTESITITVVPDPTLTVLPPVVADFETGLPQGWGANGDWEFGTPPARAGATTTLVPGPFDGACAATKLAANYSNSTGSRLVTPLIDFTGVAAPEVRFVHFFNTAGATTDAANLKVSFDGGSTFQVVPDSTFVALATPTRLYTNTVNSTTNPLTHTQRAWGGRIFSENWETARVDVAALFTLLAAPRIDQVVFRFDFGANSSGQGPGWFIDRVRIGDADTFPGEAPVFVTPAPTSAQEGRNLQFPARALGVPAPSYSLLAGGPPWLTVGAQTGILAGTPPGSDVGVTFPVTLRATNAAGSTDQVFSMRVIPAGVTAAIVEGFEGVTSTGTTTRTVALGSGSWSLSAVLNSTGAVASTNWEIGTPNFSYSGIAALPDRRPTAAFAGSGVAGTVIGGNYLSNSARHSLETPVMNLGGLADPILQFRHWYTIENGFDGARIAISFDGGATYTPIGGAFVRPTYDDQTITGFPNPSGGTLPGWTFGDDFVRDWTVVEVDLDAAAAALGQTLNATTRIRFDFGVDGSGVRAGWYLDEVRIGDRATFP